MTPSNYMFSVLSWTVMVFLWLFATTNMALENYFVGVTSVFCGVTLYWTKRLLEHGAKQQLEAKGLMEDLQRRHDRQMQIAQKLLAKQNADRLGWALGMKRQKTEPKEPSPFH